MNPAPQGGLAFAEGDGRLKPAPQNPSPAEYADAATGTLMAEAGAGWAQVLDQVKALALKADKEGKSLAEFRDVLLHSFAELDSEQLAQVMSLGFACADLTGRFDVKNGN